MARIVFLELQAIANGIGKNCNGTYIKEYDAIDCVKDLIKSLRRDNETCDIRRFLGDTRILQKDLIPLVATYGFEDEELFDVTIRCLMNLTQPARIVYRNEIPQDKTTRRSYMDVEAHLRLYKQAFINKKFLTVLTQKLKSLLNLDWEERQEEQNLLIERILVLIRNILHIPPTDEDKLRTDNDAGSHDQLIWNMQGCGLETLILYIASNEGERRFCIHILEIVSLMFKEQTPEQLVSAGGTRDMREQEKDELELAKAAEIERAEKRAQLLKISSRHSRFGGTFVMKGTKSISEKDLIYHRAITDVKEHTFDSGKKPKKKPKNRKPINGDDHVRQSTLSIRVCLKEFCIEFLRSCYNPLMRAVKSALDNENSQEHDETYYLWSMRFFIQFQRLYKLDVELIRETLTVQDFHYVHTMMLSHQDMMTVDKKEAITWGKRLHLALRTYRELLETLSAMSVSASSNVRESAKIIQQNVFYLMEYRDILVLLLKKFDNTRQSKLFARDLVQTAHLYIRGMEKWSASQGRIIVQKKVKKAVRRKKKTPNASEAATAQPAETEMTQEQLEEKWEEISGDLSELLQDLLEINAEGVSPFDAASDVPIDDQRMECVRNISECLHNGYCSKSVALLRAARDVWPDNEEFGTRDITPEDEFMLLREIFFANLTPCNVPADSSEVAPEDDGEQYGEEIENEEMDGVEEVVEKEQELNFKDFLSSFASSRILPVYTFLLSQYKTNDVHTNHCIVKMLHRISVQFGMVALLFQLSVFRTFQKILNDPAAKASQFNEMKTFALFVMRQFFKCAQKNPKVYVEMMFWKNPRECHEVMEGYGTYKAANAASKVAWTEEQELELRELYEEHKHSDGDLVDKIMAGMIDTSRTRRQIIKQLLIMDLVTDPKQLKKSSGRTVAPWREDEIDSLKNLYELHRDDPDCVGEIMLKLDRSRPQIVNKLVELGVVDDRKKLRKPQSRKKRRHGGSSDGEESDEEPVHIGAPTEGNAQSDSSGDEDEKGRSANNNKFNDLVRGDPEVLLSQLRADSNMEYALTWIQRCLNRTAEDREDGDQEATPIVPLLEECETALEDKAFQRFLYTIGINPPLDEQERYWRISKELDPEKLRQIAKVLEVGSDERFPQLEFTYSLPNAGQTSRKQPIKTKLVKKKSQEKKAPAKKPRKPSKPEWSKQGLTKAPVSKEFVDDDISSDDSERESKLEIDEAADLSVKRPKKKPRLSAAAFVKNSDDEEDLSDKENTAVEDNSEAESDLEMSNRGRQVSDDEESPASGTGSVPERISSPSFESFPATALTQDHQDSSDSEDDHLTISRAARGQKRKAIEESDSD